MLRLLRIWPSLGGSCASLESLDLSVYGSLGRHKNPLERAQILNSPRWVWIISQNDLTQPILPVPNSILFIFGTGECPVPSFQPVPMI